LIPTSTFTRVSNFGQNFVYKIPLRLIRGSTYKRVYMVVIPFKSMVDQVSKIQSLSRFFLLWSKRADKLQFILCHVAGFYKPTIPQSPTSHFAGLQHMQQCQFFSELRGKPLVELEGKASQDLSRLFSTKKTIQM
jgi:hypothetical protein